MTEKLSKILPPNSLNAQFVPHFQNVASDLNKTRNQLYEKNGQNYVAMLTIAAILMCL
jgi:hypothetical protein